MQEPQNRFVRFASAPISGPATQDFHQAFESLILSANGGVLIVGWIDDSTAPIEAITVTGNGWRLRFDANMLARLRRRDVEDALGTRAIHRYGYFGFIAAGEPLLAGGDFSIEIALRGGWTIPVACAPKVIDDADLLDLALSYLAGSQHYEEPEIGAIAAIEGGVANEIVIFGQSIASHATDPYVKRFGANRARYRGSVIVYLRESVEPYAIQNALFATGAAAAAYEFIYVCDSPDLAEPLLSEARLAPRLYGTNQTIVMLPAVAGFGAACNAGAAVAQSDRLLFADAGLLPRDANWAERHEALLEVRPPDQTKLFGAPLLHENGALRHRGFYYDLRSGPYLRNGEIIRFQLAEIRDLATGAAPDAAIAMGSHPVPGIGRAFMSVDRNWFETLEGFSASYLHGDYQDADICLRSIAEGVPPWLHDLRFWHVNAKSPSSPAAYEGGSIVNRWLFSASWGDTIAGSLSGRSPTHVAFQQKSAEELDTLRRSAA